MWDTKPEHRQFSPLHIVAVFGITGDIVDEVIKATNDINEVDSRGRSPLTWAAKEGHTDIVRRLLAVSKTEVNIKDSTNHTAILWASKLGHKSVVKLLLKRKEVTLVNGVLHALMLAVANNHVEVVKLLLTHPRVATHKLNSDGRTPLHRAAAMGYLAVVKALIKNYTRNNFPIGWDADVLQSAVIGGHVDVVKLLLDHITLSALQLVHILSLLSHSGSDDLFLLLVLGGKEPTLEVLNLIDTNGRRPVSYAAEGGLVAGVKMLLSKGATLLPDEHGRTLVICRRSLEA